jgi:hypothetical protein
MQQRLLRQPADFATLDYIASALRLTGERLRVIEDHIVQMLQSAIWDDDYLGCRFRFRSSFVQPLRKLREQLGRRPHRCEHEQRRGTSVASPWNTPQADSKFWTVLLLRLLNLPVKSAPGLEAAFLPDAPPLTKGSGVKALRNFLASCGPRAFTVLEVASNLQLAVGAAAPDVNELRRAFRSTAAIEYAPDTGQYRVALPLLRTYPDRAERILRDHGKPLHFREIYRLLGQAAPEAIVGLSVQAFGKSVANCKRFTSLGRSGFWGLPEWALHGGTVAELAAQLCADRQGPVAEREIYEFVCPLRPVARNSIGTLLREDGRFLRVAPATWQLTTLEPLA